MRGKMFYRDDEGVNNYLFYMNDKDARTIQIIIPARSEEEARATLDNMLYQKHTKESIRWHYWLSCFYPY